MPLESSQNFKEKLIKRAYFYALNVVELADSSPNQKSCQIIAGQLLRSATSVGANIIEAQAASSRKDFINFLSYALKSANESKFWLGLLRDSKKSSPGKINPFLDETTELAKILGSAIITLRGKKLII